MPLQYWDVEQEAFIIDAVKLIIEIEDVHLFSVLSHHVEEVSLRTGPKRGFTIQDYVNTL